MFFGRSCGKLERIVAREMEHAAARVPARGSDRPPARRNEK